MAGKGPCRKSATIWRPVRSHSAQIPRKVFALLACAAPQSGGVLGRSILRRHARLYRHGQGRVKIRS